MKAITYPFKPKSTTYMRPGQFWAIPLDDIGHKGWYGCGRVLELNKSSRRWFIAGLMAWVDTHPPNPESLIGAELLGQMHTRTDYLHGDILGFRALEDDGLEPLLWLDCEGSNHSNPNHRPSLMRGLTFLREASAAEHQALRSQKGGVMSYGSLFVDWWSDELESLIAQRKAQ